MQEEERACCDFPLPSYLSRKAAQILSHALGGRALGMRALPPSLPPSSSTDGKGGKKGGKEGGWVWIGVRIDPAQALRLVDRGPPAEEAKKAKEVWGEGGKEGRREGRKEGRRE